MDKRVEQLMEQFNSEFPNGDSLELAQFMYAHGFDDGYVKGYEDEAKVRDSMD